MKRHNVSFSIVLPLLSSALWVALIAIPATLAYVNMRHISRNGSGVTFHSHQYSFTVPRNRFFASSVRSSASLNHKVIEAANLPGFSIELLQSRLSSSWPMSWTPAGMDIFTWRAIIFPFYCLPFWWFVGLGVDALLRRRKLRWPVLLLGTLLCGFFLFLILGLRFGLSAEERDGLVYPFLGFGLWIVLFGIFPMTWVRSWVLSRHPRPTQTPSP